MKTSKKIFLMILCLCLFTLMALGSDTNNTTAKKVGEVSENGTSTGTNTDNKAEYRVGETYTNDGLSVTFVSSGNYTSDNQFIQPGEGKKYIRLSFHVENKSDSDKSVTSVNFDGYADGYKCQSCMLTESLSLSLSKGRSGDGSVYFEVPVDAKVIEIEFASNMFSDKKIKFIFEGDKDSGLKFDKNVSVSENAFHKGDIIETKNIRISYLKAGEFTSDNQFLQPKEGMKYVYIELEVENISSSDHTISYFSFECYADGTACEGYYGREDLLSATLSAGRKAKGTVAFEVPVNAKVIEIEYEDNFWTESKVIFLVE